MIDIHDIRTLCRGRIELGAPLAPLTSFRIGGPADVYVEPGSEEELLALVAYFEARGLPVLILGNGSNILVHDDGFRGVAINLSAGFSQCDIKGNEVVVGAGCRLAAFVSSCIHAGLQGVEELAGIPGTIGGALIMNAGAHGKEIGHHCVDVRILRRGRLLTLGVADCGFRYRDSDLRDDMVLGARFHLLSGDPTQLRERRRTLIDTRNATQPLGRPNAGSVFRNPEGDYAGRLIEVCGLKGYRIGGAVVSDRHANFILNDGEATAEDVVALMRHIRAMVFEKTGVRLDPEIRCIGWTEHPLGGEDVDMRQGGTA